MRSSHLRLVSGQTGAMSSEDLEYHRARTFFNRLQSQPFIAILVDADEDEVRMYLRGIHLNDGSLRRIRELIDEVEADMKESDGEEVR